MLAGCQTAKPQPQHAPAPAGPANEGYHRPRNPYFLPKPILVMESAELRELAKQSGEAPGQRELAWYDTRNDARMSIQSGYRTTTFESSSTYTYDRQYQHSGNVRDHYSRTTRTGSITETSR